MQWINGEEAQAKWERMQDWHPYFAWFPVVVGTVLVNGRTHIVRAWLETVERKGKVVTKYHFCAKYFDFEFSYRRRAA